MLETLPRSGGPVVGFHAAGKLSDEDYQEVLIPRLEATLSAYPKARVLIEFAKEFKGWEPEAIWDDAKFGLKHKHDFERIAVVGAPKWVEWATRVGGKLVGCQVGVYSTGQEDEAWDWIGEGVHTAL